MSGVIKEIDKKCINKICSGQVILNLPTAVKELIENCVDANATKIDIKLYDYGFSRIEVTDNGDGILSDDFASLGLKHTTSKIRSFNDLSGVTSYGFRGEALNALCTISDVVIQTRHSISLCGSAIEFDNEGQCKKITECARNQGTCVKVSNLFAHLPVRRKEFRRTIKREYGRLITVIQSYSLIMESVRFICTNITSNGSRNEVINTQGTPSMKENIRNTFGPKQMSTLIPITKVELSDDILSKFNLKRNDDAFHRLTLNGFVSLCSSGSGRSASDRQFIYINKRPCDHPKLLRLINDCYHAYNRHQYPFICLSICLGKGEVDFNITPDKRQMIVVDEMYVLAAVRQSLLHRFDIESCSLTSNILVNKYTQLANTAPSSVIDCGKPTIVGETFCSFNNKIDTLLDDSTTSICEPASRSVHRLPKLHSERAGSKDRLYRDDNIFYKIKECCDVNDHSRTNEGNVSIAHKEEVLEVCDLVSVESEGHSKITEDNVSSEHKTDRLIVCDLECGETNDKRWNIRLKDDDSELASDLSRFMKHSQTGKYANIPNFKGDSNNGPSRLEPEMVSVTAPRTSTSISRNCDTAPNSPPSKKSKGDFESFLQIDDHFSVKDVHRKCETLDVSMELLSSQFHKFAANRDVKPYDNCRGIETHLKRLFRAKIDPTSNQEAESELTRTISKESFRAMKIIGQFNKGFIVTILNDDLFIIDQHATDEKYNYEDLSANTVLEGQSLLMPKQLDLTPANLLTLLDNLQVFLNNGFDFQILEKDGKTNVSLTKIPVSKTWSFDGNDVLELLYVLSEGCTIAESITCRPSRVLKMFASRACRKSIMIGTSLTLQDMKTLVDHMASMDKPWNCPHGRPTMRHLFSLNLLDQHREE